MADLAKVRVVRCPKCRNILQEPVDYSVYRCGGCGTTLKAKHKDHGSVGLSEKGEAESDHAKSGNYLRRILIRRMLQEHESQMRHEKGSSENREEMEEEGHEITPRSSSGFSSSKDTSDTSLSEIEEIGLGEWMETEFTEIPQDYSFSDSARILKLREGSSGMLSDHISEADIFSIEQQKDNQSSMAKADIPIATTVTVLPLTDTPKAISPLKVETLSEEDSDNQRSSFEVLKVSTISQLLQLPTKLHSLKIDGCGSLEALPDDLLAGRTTLKELYLISCASLSSFPYPGSLTTLYIHKCRRLEFLPSLESSKKLAFLQNLCIGSSCDSLTTLTLDLFPKLKILCIWDCPNLHSVNFTGEFKGDLASLESLEIRDCPRLSSLPDGGLHTPNLESILIFNCKNLNALPNAMNFLASLRTLFLHRCPQIESLPHGGLPSSLTLLSIAYCDKLIPQKDWRLDSLESLNRFELEGGCMGMDSFPEDNLLPCNINSLRISTMHSLKKLNYKGFQHLNALQTLEIHGCDMLQSLPDQGLPSSLSNLCVQECPLLTPRLKPKRGKEWHKVAHIPHIQIDHQLLSA
ncbi:hypothetical protein HN51_010755 [Arachis hypogaea]|uniref:Enhanced disease resistance 4-like N-terminal domain-containing protein n=1 Tax=Arachis hypogaea TaxID=3818 RepID=A0A445E232_ARAHY|nr:putative disease resistance protein At3g14460 isoform X2 [Arachis hypogaea]QHO55897.1 Putative disease resistance protein [Arachis hypogaea]RYR69475.1 hypothetical protein Ahy_A03g016031 isoform B [Arachis hypogaea]